MAGDGKQVAARLPGEDYAKLSELALQQGVKPNRCAQELLLASLREDPKRLMRIEAMLRLMVTYLVEDEEEQRRVFETIDAIKA